MARNFGIGSIIGSAISSAVSSANKNKGSSSKKPAWQQQAEANSEKWHTASQAEKDRLHAENQKLYGDHGYTYANGEWKPPTSMAPSGGSSRPSGGSTGGSFIGSSGGSASLPSMGTQAKPDWLQKAEANSQAWHTAGTQAEKDRLHAENQRLYGSHGYTYENGEWKAPGSTTPNIGGTVGGLLGSAINMGLGMAGSAMGSTLQAGRPQGYNPSVDYGDLGSNQVMSGADWRDVWNTVQLRDQKAEAEGLSKYQNDATRAMLMSYINTQKAAEEQAQRELEAQKEREAQLQAYYEAARNQIAQQYDQLLPGLNQSYDEAARQAYINSRLAQRDLPAQLAAAGISGQGAAESTIAAQNTAYNQAYNDNEMARQNALQQVYNNKLNALAGNSTQAAQAMAELGTQLAAERQNILAQQNAMKNQAVQNFISSGQMMGAAGSLPTLAGQQMALDQAYNNAVLQQQQQNSDREYWLRLWEGMGTNGANAAIARALGIPVGAIFNAGSYNPKYY